MSVKKVTMDKKKPTAFLKDKREHILAISIILLATYLVGLVGHFLLFFVKSIEMLIKK